MAQKMPPPLMRKFRSIQVKVDIQKVVYILVMLSVLYSCSILQSNHLEAPEWLLTSQQSGLLSPSLPQSKNLTVLASAPTGTKMKFLYVVSSNDTYQRERVHAFSTRLFGPDDFLVVWDNSEHPQCPFQDDRVRCIDKIAYSEPRGWALHSMGLEKAIMWSIANKDNYDYIWIMESDVHYTSEDILSRAVATPSNSDLLHAYQTRPCGPWYHRDQFEAVNNYEMPCRHAILAFYRLSSRLLARLEEFYVSKNNRWALFEALLPSMIRYYNMTEEVISVRKRIRYRPCFTEFPKEGIYHPVKVRNGVFEGCNKTLWNVDANVSIYNTRF